MGRKNTTNIHSHLCEHTERKRNKSKRKVPVMLFPLVTSLCVALTLIHHVYHIAYTC